MLANGLQRRRAAPPAGGAAERVHSCQHTHAGAAVFGTRRLVIAPAGRLPGSVPGGVGGADVALSAGFPSLGYINWEPILLRPPGPPGSHLPAEPTNSAVRATRTQALQGGRCLRSPGRQEEKPTPPVCRHIPEYNHGGGWRGGFSSTPRGADVLTAANAPSSLSRGWFDFRTFPSGPGPHPQLRCSTELTRRETLLTFDCFV